MNKREARWLVFLAVVAGNLFATIPAAAHHSRANFNLDATIEISGTITRWRYRNPHAFLSMDVTNKSGEIQQWDVELGSIPNLKQMGMERESLKVGDRVTVVANPDRKAASHYVFFNSMTLSDGTRYSFDDVFAYSRAAKEAGKYQPGSSDFTGKWDEVISRRAVLVGSGLPDYPVTEKGQAVVARYVPSEEPWFSCQSAGLPSLVGTPYAIEFTKSDDGYHIYYEFPGFTRTIHMNMPEHPQDVEPSVYGHSIGRMEDGALIVDTVGFTETKWGIGPGLDSSEEKHLIERHELKEEGHILEIQYTVTDPVFLASPYSKTHTKRIVPDYEITAYEDCDPEAARMHLELEGK